jgi:branched-chain amino acid transport system substrate-binding protein
MTFPVSLAMLLAALTATAVAAAPEPVHIDVILSQTGTAAFLGQGESQALKILQGVVNTRGGINGRPVQFDIGDDQSTPTQAVALMNGAQAHKPGALLGTGFTATCLAILPLAARNNGPATYCMTPGVHPPAGSYGFSANIGTESMAPVMLRFFKQKGWTKFAFMNSTDASGQDVLEAVTRAMKLPEFKTMTMVAEEHFNTSDISVSAQIARIKSATPQAVIFWTAGTGFGTVLRNAHDAGLDIPTIGGNANELYAQMLQYKSFLPTELYFPSPRSIAEGGTFPGPIKDAQSIYFKAFKTAGLKPDLSSTMAWDPALIIIDAYKHLGADAPADKVRDYIAGLHGWVGVNGLYDFRDGSQRGLGQNACVMLRYDGAKNEFLNASRPAGFLK